MIMDLIEVSDVDKAIVKKKVSQFLTEAKAVEITDEDDYQYAAELLIQEKTIYKYVEKTYEETKKSLNEAKANLMKLIRTDTDPLNQAEGIIKEKMGVWYTEQERLRAETRRKIEAKLRKQEEERRLNEAVETGDESVLEEPIIVSTPQVQEAPKVKGISFTEIVKFKIVDSSKVPFPDYWKLDEEKIGKVARATKGEIKIEGVEIWKEKSIGARSR